ncbi:MAG TPA: hypothetical protein VD905_20700 [Flavobacteriales bacterium]|nr:hypothetical protein [Flavobacteriales bacterium]
MEELDQSLAKEPKIISNIFARVYTNWGVTALVIVFALIGIVGLSNGNVLCIIPLVLGVGGLTFNYGIDVDVNNNRHRDFVSIFFMKFGTWKSLNLYPYITVLKTNKGRSAFGAIPIMTGAAALSATLNADYSDGEFGIYLLNQSHYKKIELEIMDDLKKANERLEYFSRAMNKEIATYKPVRISKIR